MLIISVNCSSIGSSSYCFLFPTACSSRGGGKGRGLEEPGASRGPSFTRAGRKCPGADQVEVHPSASHRGNRAGREIMMHVCVADEISGTIRSYFITFGNRQDAEEFPSLQ